MKLHACIWHITVQLDKISVEHAGWEAINFDSCKTCVDLKQFIWSDAESKSLMKKCDV